MEVALKPIGIIHSPFKSMDDAPFQGAGSKKICKIEVFKEFAEGLKDIEGFSHIFLIYLFDRSKGYSLKVVTPWDPEPHGLFTTRSPRRPNPIGISVVNLLDRKDNILIVKECDALDGSPLLDIKPYVPEFDIKPDAKPGWFEKSKLKEVYRGKVTKD